jgi:uncharacterized SAM-binding protein YcdF (DUF218 family)
MFLLSKLLPLLLLPLGLALLLLVWAVWRGGRTPVLAALGLLWLFATPLTAEGLWRWLERPYQRRSIDTVLQGFACALPARPSPPVSYSPAERLGTAQRLGCAVVVLGTGRHAAPGPARASEWTDADRFFGGIEAYQHLRAQGFRPRLIFTGGWWPTQPSLRPEGDELRLRAIALGLPPADLLSTSRVRNTAEEARAIAALVPPGAAVVLVTSAFHMPRAQRLFERQGLSVVPLPVDFQATGAWAGHPLADPLNYLPSADGLASSSRALREAIGRTLYRSW